MLAAVGVEAIGVDRVARPDPPQRQEHQHEVQELLRRDVAVVRLAQDLAGVVQGDDDNQVEEQLQPGRAPVRVEISQVLHGAIVCLRARPLSFRPRAAVDRERIIRSVR